MTKNISMMEDDELLLNQTFRLTIAWPNLDATLVPLECSRCEKKGRRFIKCASVCSGPNFFLGAFPFGPPPPERYASSVTEHVPLHRKYLCKNMTRALEGVQIICTH